MEAARGRLHGQAYLHAGDTMTTSEALGATTSSFKSTYTLPDGAVTPSSDSRVLPPLSILSGERKAF